MNIVWGFVIIVAVTAVAVAAMLFVRRTAPEGSYFEDGDRASGVFGCWRPDSGAARVHHLPRVRKLRPVA